MGYPVSTPVVTEPNRGRCCTRATPSRHKTPARVAKGFVTQAGGCGVAFMTVVASPCVWERRRGRNQSTSSVTWNTRASCDGLRYIGGEAGLVISVSTSLRPRSEVPARVANGFAKQMELRAQVVYEAAVWTKARVAARGWVRA